MIEGKIRKKKRETREKKKGQQEANSENANKNASILRSQPF